jgi:hypothetical protein
MPLQPQTQEIPFRFGIDRTEDPEGRPIGALDLQNYDFDEEGVMLRRGGLQAYAAVSPFRGNMVGTGDARLLLQNTTTPIAVGVGSAGKPFRSVTQLSPGARTISVDAAYSPAANATCYVITAAQEAPEDAAAGTFTKYTVFAYVVDAATGQTLYADTVATNASRGLVATTDGGAPLSRGAWIIVYVQGQDFYATQLTKQSDGTYVLGSSPALISPMVGDYAGSPNAAHTINLVAISPTVAQATFWTFAGLLPLTYKQTAITAQPAGSPTITSTIDWPNAPVGAGPGLFWDFPKIAGGSGYQISWVQDGAGPNGGLYLRPISNPDPLALRIGTTNGGYPQVIACEMSAGELFVAWRDRNDVVYEKVSIPSTDSIVITGPVRVTGATLGTGAVRKQNDGYVSVYFGFFSTDGALAKYPNLLLGEVRQTDAFADPAELRVVGQLAYDEYAFANYANHADQKEGAADYLPPIAALPDGRFQVGVPTSLETGPNWEDRDSNVVRRIAVREFVVPTTADAHTVNLRDMHFITGSYLQASDGKRVFAAAFLAAPAAPIVEAGSAPPLPAGHYGWRVVFEFVDLHGNLQVSPPSPIVDVTVAGAVGTRIRVPIPAYAQEIYGEGYQNSLRVKIYRTPKNGSTFNLIAATSVSEKPPVPTEIVFDDSVTEEEAAVGELLYTDSGKPPAALAPPVRHMTVHRNRLIAIREDRPENVLFTAASTGPSYPVWSNVFSFQVDNQGGPPLAVASLFDKIVILQRHQISVVTGEGPDERGAGAFSLPETVARGVGVMPDQLGSVLETPMGVFFAHDTGLHLLTPSLEVVAIGRALGGKTFIHDHPIHRARYVPNRSQAWFFTTGAIYVYDFRAKRWSTFTSSVWPTLYDVTQCGTDIYLLGPSQIVRYAIDRRIDSKLIDGVLSETGGMFPQFGALPWFRQDRAQELRLWKLFVTGSRPSSADVATLTAAVYSDDERRAKGTATPDNAYSWTLSTAAGTKNNFLLKGRLVSQRSRAFRCEIIVQPGVGYSGGELLRLSSVTYDFGIVPGRGKTRARASAT